MKLLSSDLIIITRGKIIMKILLSLVFEGVIVVGMERFTHLGRPIDLTYPTNRWIVVIVASTLITVAGWGLLAQRLLLNDALLQGAEFAGAVFLAWALGRETDPDAEIMAFFVIPPTILLVSWLGKPAFDLLFLTLLLMRVVNRTIGLVAKPGDVVLVLALTIWVAHDGAWYIVLCTAMAFALDGSLIQPHPSHRWVAILLAVVSLFLFITTGWLYNPILPTSLLWLVCAGVLGPMAMLLYTPKIQSKSDHGGPIHLQRLQASWLLALLLAIVSACFGAQGLATLSPVWSVLIVAGIYRLALRTRTL